MAHSVDIAKVKKWKVKLTRSKWTCAQWRQMYHENVIRLWEYARLIRNPGRRSEWQGQFVGRKLLNSRFCARVWKYI